jgi:hypothetical protein
MGKNVQLQKIFSNKNHIFSSLISKQDFRASGEASGPTESPTQLT